MSKASADPSAAASESRRRWRLAAGVAARAGLIVAFLSSANAAAAGAADSPFLPPPAPKPKIVRLLAYPEYFDPTVLDAFERASGFAVAYDAYESPDAIADKWRDGPYDLVVLPGPALARRIAMGALARLDESKLPGARAVQGAVAAKLAAYDPPGAYSVAFGWSPIGLLYDADKAAMRLGGAPSSWANLLLPALAGKMANCGVALPDARDALFIAAWRFMNVDPARPTLPDVKGAAVLLTRAKSTVHGFAARDIVGSLARGDECLAMGMPSEADAAAARGREGGALPAIRFVEPKEGGALALDAFAIPRDAPHPEQGYALLQFLLRPENAQANARTAGVVGAEVAGQDETLKHLWPEGAFDARLSVAVETEWAHVRAAK